MNQPVGYDYAAFSTLAGPLTEPPADGYRVRFRKVMVGSDMAKVLPLLIVTVGLSSLFFAWLLQPQHHPDNRFLPQAVVIGNEIMFWLIVVTEGIRLVNSFTLCLSAYIMRDPVPVVPTTGLRVAFTTTIVPSKEPIDVVRDTLIAARNIQYERPIDVWILDEGDDADVRAMCEEIGVRHFSRKGVERWNTTKGSFRAKTKHGNHNSWLDAYGDRYDVVLSVDPDHIPLPNFAERMLGYFRDPDVAFVVGPQVYGNFRHYLTRGAEAQNYMFHSVVQRAGNAFGCGMFVGTNHAYRVGTWRQIGGFQDSITEDLATSFAVHGAHNPDTGRRWKSVYTPDVVAVGEGPANWTDFFSQQLRWARGANEVMITQGARRLAKLGWRARGFYSMLMLHYPTVALTWLLGTLLTICYMALGSTGVRVEVPAWLALYVDVFAARLLLYFWLRHYNISPHEERGSAGMSGIFVSVLCTPFYSTAFVGALLRRPLGFVVTPKGKQASPDRLATFRKHFFWAAISGGSIAAAAALGHVYPANMIWVSLSFVTCLTPVVLWSFEPILAPRRAKKANPLPAAAVRVPAQQTQRDLEAQTLETQTIEAQTLAAFEALPADEAFPEWSEDTVRISGARTPLSAAEETVRIDASVLADIVRRATGPMPVPKSPAPDRADEPLTSPERLPSPEPWAEPVGARGWASNETGVGPGAGVNEDATVTLRSLSPASPYGSVSPTRAPVRAPARAPAAGSPRYTEDVTLLLKPRRRRVSLDGLLEELK